MKHYGWLLRTKLASQLIHLAIESEPTPIASWLDKGLARLPALETLELEDTPPYVVGGLVPAGGRDIAGAPCEVRWFVRRIAGERPLRAELAIGWPYFKDRLRDIRTILGINLRGFPRDDVPGVMIRYTGKRGAEFDIGRLSRDLERLLAGRFRRIELPDGRVVGAGPTSRR